jgi:TolB protein
MMILWGVLAALPAISPATISAQTKPLGRLALTMERNSRLHIFTADLDGGNLFQVTDGPEIEVGPRWSPDGDRLAFLRVMIEGTRKQAVGLFVVGTDGKNQMMVTSKAPIRWAWSPDGAFLSYETIEGMEMGFFSEWTFTLSRWPRAKWWPA